MLLRLAGIDHATDEQWSGAIAVGWFMLDIKWIRDSLEATAKASQRQANSGRGRRR